MTVLNSSLVGFSTPSFTVEVEKGRLRLFCKAIGETSSIYKDEDAAIEQGFRSIPVPLTFLFCLEMEREDPYDWFKQLNIPLQNVLHGEQKFADHRIACAGDTLNFRGEVAGVYHKKQGMLEFLVHKNYVRAANSGHDVAEFQRTLVIQHRE